MGVIHEYISTACNHERHDECRKTCKFCDSECKCTCHFRLTVFSNEYLSGLKPVGWLDWDGNFHPMKEET